MGRRPTLLLLLLVLLAAPPALPAPGDGFRIVVHPSNPGSSMTRKELSRIFLKKSVRWQHGGEIVPVDQGLESPVRDAFSRDVHGRGASAIRTFWQQQIYSGRGVPPPELASDREVIAFVADNPAAIGYVAAGSVTPRVKVLELVE